MNTVDLGGPILKSVSRSFYLSVRVLPGPLRSPIGLAYLLARASDTIADTAAIPAEIRVGHLAAYGAMVQTGSRTGLGELQRDIAPGHEGEQRLISQVGRCLDWLDAVPARDRQEIRDVLAKIIRGQTLDLQRFPGNEETSPVITALQTAAELEEYTYLVAGCVGEFWTRISILHLPGYSRMNEDELSENGRNLGKALQLVNILRDMPADLRQGRCYLPEAELRAAGISPASLETNPALAQPIFDRWRDRAGALLDSGSRYIRAIRPARARVACYLPWYLAKETLELLRHTPPLQTPVRVKVPRSTVYAALLKAPFVGLSNASLPR